MNDVKEVKGHGEVRGQGEENTPEADLQRSCLTISTPLKTCLVISLSFTFTFTASLSINNITSSLYRDNNLGIWIFATVFGSIVTFSPLTPVIIQAIGAKNVLITAFTIFTCDTFCNFYPTFATMLPSSVLKGFISGPMWTAEGLYVTSAGEEYARMFTSSSEREVHAVLSRFNGIFFMFYETSQLTGNLISSLVLWTSSYTTQENSTTLEEKTCGVDAYFANNSVSQIQDPETHTVYLLLGVLAGCNIMGLSITVFALPKLKDRGAPSGKLGTREAMEGLQGCLKVAIDRRMLLLLPFFMAQSMAVAVLVSDYNRDYISCSLGIQWVGYIMTSYGLCCAVFAMTLNSLARYLGRLTLFVLATLADVSTLVTMLLWQPRDTDAVFLFFLVPAISGVSEGILQSQFYTIVAQVFSDNQPPAFASYHTSKALSFTISFLMSMYVPLTVRLWIAIALYTVGLLGYLVIEWRSRSLQGQGQVDDKQVVEDVHGVSEFQDVEGEIDIKDVQKESKLNGVQKESDIYVISGDNPTEVDKDSRDSRRSRISKMSWI